VKALLVLLLVLLVPMMAPVLVPVLIKAGISWAAVLLMVKPLEMAIKARAKWALKVARAVLLVINKALSL
jgi:hypothetical protein